MIDNRCWLLLFCLLLFHGVWAQPSLVEQDVAVAQALLDAGKTAEGEQALLEVLATWRANGPDDPALRRCLAALEQSAMTHAGEHAPAETTRDVLRRVEARLGADDPLLISLLTDLGVLLAQQHHDDDANAQYTRLRAIAERAYGTQHPLTVQALTTLGRRLRGINRYELADAILHDALARSGALTPAQLLPLVDELAIVNYQRGRFTEAAALWARAVQAAEACYGPDDPRLAQYLHNQGAASGNAGDSQALDAIFARVVAIYEKAYGPDDPQLGSALHNLATVYANADRIDEADRYLARALAIHTAANKRDDMAWCLAMRCRLYQHRQRYTEAEACGTQALQIVDAMGDAPTEQRAHAREMLGLLYIEMGRYPDAETMLEQAVQQTEAALGVDHPFLADRLRTLAGLRTEQGRLVEAETDYLRALARYRQCFAPNHLNIATCRVELADVYLRQRRDADALNLLLQAHGPLAAAGKAAWVDCLLGVAWGRRGADLLAEVFFRRALRTAQARPYHDILLARCLRNQGIFYTEQRRYRDAETTLNRALALLEAHIAPEHPDIARTWMALGACAEAAGNRRTAADEYQRAFDSFQRIFPHDQRDTREATAALVRVQ